MNQVKKIFTPAQRKLLFVCAVLIVLSSAILLIDKFIVQEPKPEMKNQLADIASKLKMNISTDAAHMQELTKIISAVPELSPAPIKILSVLHRQDALHELWLFEFRVNDTLLVASDHLGNPNEHTGEIDRFAMVVKLSQANFPNWLLTGSAPLPSPPWNDAARSRAMQMADLQLAMFGEYFIALSKPSGLGLLEQAERERSAEFHAGLYNSALAIDAQRFLDVINLLDSGVAELPRIYHIEGIDTNLPKPSIAPLSDSMKKAREKNEKALQELRDKLQAQREQYQKDKEARSENAPKPSEGSE